MTKSIPPIPIKIGDGNATFAVNGQTCGEHSHEMTMEMLNCAIKLTERCQYLEAQVRDMAMLLKRAANLLHKMSPSGDSETADNIVGYLRQHDLPGPPMREES